MFLLKACSELREIGELWAAWELLVDSRLLWGLWTPQELLTLVALKALSELLTLGLEALWELQAALPRWVDG